MASDHRARAKGDEATHSPRSRETKGSRKLLAPLKRTSVMLSSVRVSREKGHNKGYTREHGGVEGGGMRATGRGMSKTPTNTTLEPLYYTVVQQYTT